MITNSFSQCLLVASNKTSSLVEDRLNPSFSLIVKHKFNRIDDTLRNNNISCIIIDIDSCETKINELLMCKQNFPLIPIICLVDKVDLDLIINLGSNGIEKALLFNQIEKLSDLVKTLILQVSASVKLNELGIDVKYYGTNLKMALLYIESNYTSIISLNQIEKFVGLSDNVISREFKKNDLYTPKRILLLFKIMHAVKLMRNKGLGLKQIAFYSGFTCEKRFNEGFHRLFSISPSAFRLYGKHNDENIWMDVLLNTKSAC